MLNSTQFAMAVHVMTALAFNEGATLPSAKLAETIGTNPSFLRQLIGKLAAAGLVVTKLGKGGGTSIGRTPSKITLLDIYRATSPSPVVPQHPCNGNQACVVADAIPTILDEIDSQLRRVVENELTQTTLASVVARHVNR